jgi:excisionase family DNA binding protein
MDMEQDKLLKPQEVAQYLQISESKVYYLIAQGSLPHIKIGRNVRVRKADLERWLDKLWVDEQPPLPGLWPSADSFSQNQKSKSTR